MGITYIMSIIIDITIIIIDITYIIIDNIISKL